MRLTVKIAPAILVIGFGGMIFGIGLGVAAFVRDLNQAQVKSEIIPITVYLFWLGLTLAVGLALSRFNLMRTAQFLSRWGVWPALLLTLLKLEPVQSLRWALLQWLGFLIWFVPIGVVCLILGAREICQQNAEMV